MTAAAAAGSGEACFKKLFDMKDSVKSKVNFDELNKCGDALVKSAGNDLKACFDAQRPARGPGGPGGPGCSNNQN